MPAYWKSFVEENDLVGKEFSVPPESDLSGVGADIVILDEQGIKSEQTELYPGIAVAKDGFIPVGGCTVGCGDPYFINERDGEGGALYRVYHDEVSEEGYDAARAVVIVLNNYRELLNYAVT